MTNVTEIKSGSNLPAEVPMEAWGAEEADQNDILIPKMLLMQGLSKLVTDEKVRQGEIVNSVSGRVIGGREKSIEIIPITTFKFWKYSTKGPKDTKFNFERIEPFTHENADQEWEVVRPDGITERRDSTLGFYVLNAAELGSPGALPYLLAFARSSYREGRKLSTHFSISTMTRTPPAAKAWKLGCHKETKDSNDYWVFDMEESRTTTQDELKLAYGWYKTLKANKHQIDHSDEETAATAEASEISEGDIF